MTFYLTYFDKVIIYEVKLKDSLNVHNTKIEFSITYYVNVKNLVDNDNRKCPWNECCVSGIPTSSRSGHIDDVQEWPVVANDHVSSSNSVINNLTLCSSLVAIDVCNRQATYFCVLSLCWFGTVTMLISCINYYEKIMILFDNFDD